VIKNAYPKSRETSGRYQSGQLGQTVNLLAYAFVGSNPALPTVKTVVFKGNRNAGSRENERKRE
jgi:hypothetical protein